jgi:hypothetical protein
MERAADIPAYGADSGLPNVALTAARVRVISEWIDAKPSNQEMTPLEQLLFRTVVKAGEEVGEFQEALVAWRAQNPRKDEPGSFDQVVKEGLDSAATWLLGVEHMTGNKGLAVGMLIDHIAGISRRAGLE